MLIYVSNSPVLLLGNGMTQAQGWRGALCKDRALGSVSLGDHRKQMSAVLLLRCERCERLVNCQFHS